MNVIAIVGDYRANNRSHIATSDAVSHCSAALGLVVEHRWIGTDELAQPDGIKRLKDFNGLWIAPGSPYKSMRGALLAIQSAREHGIPLLGTCGGFQHIILEFARNVLGFDDAEHEESSPQASRLLISRLACSLVGRTMRITLQPDSLVARSYGRTKTHEQYHCNFGVNPKFEDVLRSSALRVVGSDDEGVTRVVELAGHPFFVGTLFIPQLVSTPSAPHPLVSAFIQACSRRIVDGGLDDPRVRTLLALHINSARAETAPGSAHALDLSALKSPDIRFWSLWEGDCVVAVGALKRLSESHGEVKSMHTAQSHRRKGAGSAMLRHIIASARISGFSRLSVETGSWTYFNAARNMYKRHGFVECEPFGNYIQDPNSIFMTLEIR
jgi:GNAT superfamily N-acetyltransferase